MSGADAREGVRVLPVVSVTTNVYGRGSAPVMRSRDGYPLVVVVELELEDGRSVYLEAPLDPKACAELLVGMGPQSQGVRYATRHTALDERDPGIAVADPSHERRRVPDGVVDLLVQLRGRMRSSPAYPPVCALSLAELEALSGALL